MKILKLYQALLNIYWEYFSSSGNHDYCQRQIKPGSPSHEFPQGKEVVPAPCQLEVTRGVTTPPYTSLA